MLYLAVLGCTGLYWAVLGGTRLYWEVLDCTGRYYTVMGSTRMYRVGLMSLLMIHEAYMPVYMGSRFSLRTGARAGPPEVVQEALADLKRDEYALERCIAALTGTNSCSRYL